MRFPVSQALEGLLTCALVLCVHLPANAGVEEAPPSDSNAGWDNKSIGRHNANNLKNPATLVEWFGLNLGGGYISDSESYAKIDVAFFTVSRLNWYCTVLEGSASFGYGTVGIGSRAGYQRLVSKTMAVRVGLKAGFAFWPSTEHDEYTDTLWREGVELAPHVQLIWLLPHSSVGVGVDFPIMIGLAEKQIIFSPDYDRVRGVDGGIQIYFRWTVY